MTPRILQLFFVSITFAIACKTNSNNGNNFTISGEIKDIKDGKIMFTYENKGTPQIDTVNIQNGKFNYTGYIDEPTLYYANFSLVNMGNKPPIVLFVEPKAMKLTMSIKNPDDLILENSTSQKEYQEYKEMDLPLQRKVDSIMQLAQSQKDNQSELEKLQMVYTHVDSQESEVVKEFVKKHKNSYVSPYLILGKFLSVGDFENTTNLYKELDPKVKQSKIGEKIKQGLSAISQSSVGATAPDFSLTDINGTVHNLKDYRGKYVLIDFWASWCRPCRAENPNVVAAYNKYKNKKFEIISISLDDNADDWKSAVQNDKLAWLQLSDLQGWNSDAAKSYGVQSIPENFLVSPEGKIIAKSLRGDELEAALQNFIK